MSSSLYHFSAFLVIDFWCCSLCSSFSRRASSTISEEMSDVDALRAACDQHPLVSAKMLHNCNATNFNGLEKHNLGPEQPTQSTLFKRNHLISL